MVRDTPNRTRMLWGLREQWEDGVLENSNKNADQIIPESQAGHCSWARCFNSYINTDNNEYFKIQRAGVVQ